MLAASPALVEPSIDREERRAKREARRAKLSIENVPAPPSTDCPFAREFHVGCSGWFYWHWRGGFYAADLPTRDWFAHYADRFKTVELNATVLLLADYRHRPRMASASGATEVCLHDQSVGTHYARQTLHRD
jgi:hypothetical protein